MKSYFITVQHAAEMAPDLENPTEFIRWAEDISAIIAFTYNRDYNEVTEDLVEKTKEVQNYVGDDD